MRHRIAIVVFFIAACGKSGDSKPAPGLGPEPGSASGSGSASASGSGSASASGSDPGSGTGAASGTATEGPTVKLRDAGGSIAIPCRGPACGDPVLHADNNVLKVKIEAPDGVVARVPGAEGKNGDVVSIPLLPLAATVGLEAGQGDYLTPSPYAMKIESVVGDQPMLDIVDLDLNQVIVAFFEGARKAPAKWPGEGKTKYPKDVLWVAAAGARMDSTQVRAWDVDLIAFLASKEAEQKCTFYDAKNAKHVVPQKLNDLEVEVYDRRTGKRTEHKTFQAKRGCPKEIGAQTYQDGVTTTDSLAVTYDAIAYEAWLGKLVKPRADDAEEELPPEVELGSAAGNAATEAKSDADLAAGADPELWPKEVPSKLDGALRKLGIGDVYGTRLGPAIDTASGSRGDASIDALVLEVPKAGEDEQVATAIGDAGAFVVITHKAAAGKAKAVADALSGKSGDAVIEVLTAAGFAGGLDGALAPKVDDYGAAPHLNAVAWELLPGGKVGAEISVAYVNPTPTDNRACRVSKQRVVCVSSFTPGAAKKWLAKVK